MIYKFVVEISDADHQDPEDVLHEALRDYGVEASIKLEAVIE